MQYSHYDSKSTLSMGGQNDKSLYQTWNILVEFDDRIKTIQGY
jgi:hypothetical protein